MELKIFSTIAFIVLAMLNMSGCADGGDGNAVEISKVLENITTQEDTGDIIGEISSAVKATETHTEENSDTEEKKEANKMVLKIGDSNFTATLEDNEAVKALTEMMNEAPIIIEMSDYSGFEKVGSLGTSLPTDNKQTTTEVGDIVLYNGNQIVIFYGSNSWSYTKLGKIDDLTGWEDALGSGDVTVTFSLVE